MDKSMAYYNHRRIEAKWQKYWSDHQTFKVEIDHSRPKYYILDMFPYPSGAGLHVGHVTGYTATDILARYKRQKGFNVLHPMGWDSFGLPAEQYAARTGRHPSLTTRENISNYRRQLKSLGFSYDWDREVTTSDPSYYKWTQWIFTKLYEKGLAYQATAPVNFCPALGTVLANEEVENGRSKEGGHPVERRPLRQWVLRITEYADRLIEDLDLIDWPESLKKLQIHWIGKSVGVKIDFTELTYGNKLTIFTTCPHTLYGVTFLALAPDHPLVESIVDQSVRERVEAYQKEAARKSDLERTDLAKEQTGLFTGAYARHPVTGEKIPIWVADYVMLGYGTGAVMGVPAHDERDRLFAERYGIALREVIDETGKIVGSERFNGLDIEEAKQKIIKWLEEEKIGQRTVKYRLRDWLFSRQRYWGEPFPILYFEDGTQRALDLDELPLIPPEIVDYTPSGNGESPIAKVREWVEITDPKTGKKAYRETNTMPQWAGSCWYYLRFCDPHNPEAAWSEESQNYWLPVDLYVGGVEHAVLHLLYARFWHKVLYDCGLVNCKEPFQTLRNQGLVHASSYKQVHGGYVGPEDVVEKSGAYFHKESGVPLEMQMEKMSKSKLNGVTPDTMVDEVGADALRLYEMFMSPFDKEKIWNTEAVHGCKRFLNRYADLVFSDKIVAEEEREAMRLIHRLVQGVGEDIEAMQFNTAIAKMMEFMNLFQPLSRYPLKALKMLTLLLSPFAPHIAEEAWEHLGEEHSLAYAPFPEADPLMLEEDEVTIIVQVNGKLRGKWLFSKETREEEILHFALNQPEIKRHVVGEIEKVIWVPGKLLNLVI
jgi:leucyl-tRNA synthetase